MRALLALALFLGFAGADEEAPRIRFDLGAALPGVSHPGLLVENAKDAVGRPTRVDLVQLDGWAGADRRTFFLRRGRDERARLRIQDLTPDRPYEIVVVGAQEERSVRRADDRGRITLDFALPARVDFIEIRGPFARGGREDLAGPPAVSAWAWAIADADSGRILWSRNADVPLPMASTTKLMTAWLVLKRQDAFDDPVLVSSRADAMGGTTAALRAGQRLPVRDLVYGLLLPSGNDAAVALAEHFGPERAFVAAMNREARALGLRETRYVNPHGLDAPGHHQSARDLARLAVRFLADPEAARIVATRRRGAWESTNALLDISGYDGVKTGWTPKAGGCLVASGQKHDDRLVVVVLKSSGQESRFLDARNLLRWAWRQRR